MRSQADETIRITETGHRLQFTSCAVVEAARDPIEYVLAWLDHAAAGQGWKRRIEAQRQPDLF